MTAAFCRFAYGENTGNGMETGMSYAANAGCAAIPVPSHAGERSELILPLPASFSMRKRICAAYMKAVSADARPVRRQICFGLCFIPRCRLNARMERPFGYGSNRGILLQRWPSALLLSRCRRKLGRRDPFIFLEQLAEILRVVAQADLCGNIRHLHLRKMSEQFTGALHAQVS